MNEIPDAPWIREVEATGYYRFGWWNTPPRDPYDDYHYHDELLEGDEPDEDEEE